MLSALALTACTTSGEDLQGRFGGSSKVAVGMTLSDSSPSGARSVSASDDVMIFELKATGKTTLPAGATFLVSFKTDGDLDPAASGTSTVKLMVDGKEVGSGTFNLVDASKTEEGTATITTSSVVTLGVKATSFEVNTNTAALLAEDAGVDDPLTVSVEYNGNLVTGNTVNY